MMIERMLKEIAPGGVFHAFGHDYVVLDHNFASVAGEIGVFCLDCGDVKAYSRFNPSDADDPNNYVDSELRDESSKYSSQLYRNGLDPKNALTFSVSLNELDGSYGYGSIQAEAAPLTLWQFGRYKHLLPKNVLERPFWLVTPWTRLPNTYGSRYACYVGSDGTANGGGVGNIVKCRPALLFHPETLESVLKPPYCRIIHPKRVNIRKKTAKFCLYFKPFRHSRHPFLVERNNNLGFSNTL